MLPNLEIPADLVTFTEETLNRKLHFLCSVICNLRNKNKNGVRVVLHNFSNYDCQLIMKV